MLLVLEIVTLLAVLTLIALPLKRKASVTGSELTEGALSELLYKKDAAYVALKDLEFDYRTGKIDDTDYQSMKSQFETDAMSIIKTIDNFKADAAAKPAPVGERAEAAASFCPECGKPVSATNKFCASCGHSLSS